MHVDKSQKFGRLRIKVPQEVLRGSNKKVEWLCDCGKETTACVRSVLRGLTKSCGRCSLIPAADMSGKRFGKLRIKEPKNIFPRSMKKVAWVCDCGKESDISVNSVLSGYTRSCGRCNVLTAEELSGRRFGKLRIKEPQDLLPWSHKKVAWICDCGKESVKTASYILSGDVRSCGRCSLVPAEEFASRRFGKLRIKDPEDTFPKSNRKVAWICDCGREALATANSVTSGRTRSCGKCNTITANEISARKFGRLRIQNPKDTLPGSDHKVNWVCSCGNVIARGIDKVLNGHITSCGRCRDKAIKWWNSNQSWFNTAVFPIDPSQFPPGGVTPIETIESVSRPFKAICPCCKSQYSPRFSDVKRGVSVTCGCATNRVSSPVREIQSLIESHGPRTELEREEGGLRYDLFVPSHNLLIEFHGLKWHSMPGSRARDAAKYLNAVKGGREILVLFEDEWKHRRSSVISLIGNRLSAKAVVRLRPSKCEIRPIPSQEADPFYERFHYIGPCHPKVSYGVLYGSRMVACCSFSRPTRQSRHPWELVRMASDPEYRVHGIWSKLLKQFIREYQPSSILSFSDNRLFSGEVYRKMGFSLNGEVAPNYYWVKGQRRFHKSGLRKRGEERTSGLTEAQLREAQGYRKIWDLGKKRWVLVIGSSPPARRSGCP